MLKKTIKELSSHSFVYSLAWIASSAASILLLPVYTRYLSRSDYGILEILDYTNTILLIIIAAGLNIAIPRFFNEADGQERRKAVVSTATLFVWFAGALVCFLGVGVNDHLALLILGKADYKHLINLSIAVLYVQLFVYVASIGFIAAKRSKTYLVYMITKLLINIAANLYFIVVLKLGVLGMLYGSLLSNSLIALVITGHSVCNYGLKMEVQILGKLLKFGIPLIPAMLLATFMHNADRFLIRYFCSLDDVGIYSLGYKFPFVVNVLILQSFSYIWNGATMYEVSKQGDSAYQFGRITTYVIGFYVFVQLALSVFSVSIVRTLADQKFFAAHQIIPLVALGLCFHAFYFIFSTGTYLKKKTWLINLAYLPAAMLNIIGNIILLPKYGYMAAAWMTLITYFTFSLVLYFLCRNLVKIAYEFRRLAFLFIVAIVTYLSSSIFVFESLWMEIFKGMFFLMLFLIVMASSKWSTEGEREFIKTQYALVTKTFCRAMKQITL